jgi:lysophospholipase L1-like esterase
MPAPRRSRLRSRLRLATLLAVLLIGSLELVARLLGLGNVPGGIATPHHAAFYDANMFLPVDDPELSYRNRPDALVVVEGIEYRHDALGRRVTPRGGGDGPAPGVVFLGDSTTYGFGLRAEDSLPGRVAHDLGGAIRPVNLAVCGYCTAQETALYEAERERLGDVSLVVLVVFPNDFVPGIYDWDESMRILYVDPLPLPRGVRLALWRSALYRASASWVAYQRRMRGDYDPHASGNVEAALDSLERLAAAVRADGRQLLVAHLPSFEALDPYDFEDAARRLAARCARLGLPYVDLLEVFEAERKREIEAWEARTGQPAPQGARRSFLSRYWLVDPRDHHPNAEAVRLAARMLATHIRELLSLPDGH